MSKKQFKSGIFKLLIFFSAVGIVCAGLSAFAIHEQINSTLKISLIKYNLKELSSFAHTDLFYVNAKSQSSATLDFPLLYNEEKVLNQSADIEYQIDRRDQTYKKITNGESADIPYEQFLMSENFFRNYEFFEEEIDEGRFNFIDIEESPHYIYQFKSESLTQNFTRVVESELNMQLKKLVGDDSVSVEIRKFDKEGDFEFIFYISKESYKITRIDAKFNGKISAEAYFEGDVINQIKSLSAELGNQIDEVKATYVFSKLSLRWSVNEWVETPSIDWASNPLELFITEQLEVRI